MRYAIKNKKRIVKAYQLGAGTEMEQQLMAEGALVDRGDGTYELFSQEAVNGSGEIAHAGDYFKVDTVEGKHFPYPNKKEMFEKNHTHIAGDEYEQANRPQEIWEYGDPESEALKYLIDTGKLKIREDDETHYFNAFLFGADLSAAKDAVILFYSVDRDGNGKITNTDFNFVARAEFEKSYTYC